MYQSFGHVFQVIIKLYDQIKESLRGRATKKRVKDWSKNKLEQKNKGTKEQRNKGTKEHPGVGEVRRLGVVHTVPHLSPLGALSSIVICGSVSMYYVVNIYCH